MFFLIKRNQAINELIKETEKMVSERTVWEKLQNIQVFCGLGKFFFAFKELKDESDLEARFISLLNQKNNSIVMEIDYGKKEYNEYLDRNGIFKYHKMPFYFYLWKIFLYCKLDENLFFEINSNSELKKNRKSFISMIENYENASDLRKLVQKYIKKKEGGFGKEKIDIKTYKYSIKDIRLLSKLINVVDLYETNDYFSNIVDDYMNFKKEEKPIHKNWKKYFKHKNLEELEFLELLFKTKMFDNKKGKMPIKI